MQQRRPKTLRMAALLDKPSRRLKPVKGDYIGFTIPNEFVVGYGLDYAERYRNLKDVCIPRKFLQDKHRHLNRRRTKVPNLRHANLPVYNVALIALGAGALNCRGAKARTNTMEANDFEFDAGDPCGDAGRPRRDQPGNQLVAESGRGARQRRGAGRNG